MSVNSTLVDRLLHWESEQPQATYFTQPLPDGRVIDYSWAQVADQARCMAAHLRALNLPPLSNIALLGKNSAHWIMADLAIWMAGHVTVPLYPALNGESAAYVLDHSEAKLLFLGKMDGKSDGWTDIERVLPPQLPVIALPLSPRSDLPQWERIVADTAPLRDMALPTPDTLATILYTSGSTGRPKGVMQTHGSFVRAVLGSSSIFRMTRNDRMLSYLPLAHVAERAAVEAGSLYHGFRVFFADRLETFPQDLRRARPTVFFSVPRLWTKFYLGVSARLPDARLARLLRLPLLSRLVRRKILEQLGLQDTRLAVTGSAPLSPKLQAWYGALGLELVEFYGMTENLAYSHGGRPGQLREGYIGAAQPGVETRIADSGEVLVKSPCQMLGYYKQPELTAECMTADGFFHTGDRGVIDEQGRLRITGRVKELFKTSKGKYVAPVPIENKLAAHPRIESVCVTGPSLPQPFALLMLSPEALKLPRTELEPELSGLLQQVNVSLEDHEKLDFLVVAKEPWTVEAGFLTPTLKIKRNIIEELYLPRAENWGRAGQPVVWE